MAWKPDYTTVELLADFLKISDEEDDVELQRAVSAASRAVDRCSNRQFGNTGTAEPRIYTPRWSRSREVWRVDIDDLMSDALVVAWDLAGDKSFSTPITDFTLEPYNAAEIERPWTVLEFPRVPTSSAYSLRGSLRCTDIWGWSAVPVAVEEATLLQASRFHKRKDAPFGIAGSPSSGSEMRLLARADPDVVVALGDYRRKAFAR